MSIAYYKKGENGRYSVSFPKREYLLEVRSSFKDDVDPYVRLCEEKGRMGHWGMIRLLMPIIESIGYAQYRHLKLPYKYAAQVLKDLHIPYPHLTWLLLRNHLLHRSDLPYIAHEERGKTYWGIGFINFDEGHSGIDAAIQIDVKKLHWDLRSYLDNLVSRLSAPEYKDEYIQLDAMHVSKKLLDSDMEVRAEYDKLFHHIQQIQAPRDDELRKPT
jgi:hypothetical protein